MNDDQLNKLAGLLEEDNNALLSEYCGELIAEGVNHQDIIRAVLKSVASHAFADESWLPSASIINLSDSLVHVPLQLEQNKRHLLVFGERRPSFRRIKAPPRAEGNVEVLKQQFDAATRGNDWQYGERCLLGIADEKGINAVLATLLETLLHPRFLGTTSGPWWASVRHLLIGCMIDLRQEFGDNELLHAICNKGAKQCARKIGKRSEATQQASHLLNAVLNDLQDFGSGSCLDEREFRTQVNSGDTATAFRAITSAWKAGVDVHEIDLALTMLCVERLLRGAYGEGANWDHLKRELQATGVIRRAARLDQRLGYIAAFHAAWQIVSHGTQGLCPVSDFPSLAEFRSDDEEEHLLYVKNEIGAAFPKQAINAANNFLISGHDPKHLMRDMILWVNRNCEGSGYYAGQRGMLDAWELAKEHPERERIPLALVGWMADYRNQHFNFRKSYGPIWGANLSDDGSLLALQSGGTRLFDVATGEELMFFRGHSWRFAFHPDGRYLAAGWDGGDLQIIDLVARKVSKHWEAFPDDTSGQHGNGKFWGLAFSPDGALLAGCSRGCNEVKVWDTSTWNLKYELSGHTKHRIESVTFNADGSLVASGGCDGTVRIWNTRNGELLRTYDGHDAETGRISGLQFHPDGQMIVSAQCNGEIIVWDTKSGKKIMSAWPDRNYLNFAGFTPDGANVIAEIEGTLFFLNVLTGELTHKIEAIESRENDHTIFGGANQSRDRSILVTAGWHGNIRLWNAQTQECIQEFKLNVS